MGILYNTYDVNELYKGKTEPHVDFLSHILYGSNEFVVPTKQIADQPLLVLRTPS